jgi:sugar lactone lactonase YvrE
MERIVLRHLNGSKADHEDRFLLSEFKEIVFGRDPSSTVKFGETDTMVGRQHARITRNIAFPSRFFIIDLDSRNGTFVNGRRIVGRANLQSGDVVQFGAGGPEFRFNVEPETEAAAAGPQPAPTANLLEQAPARQARPDPSFVASSEPAPPPADGARVAEAKVAAGGGSRKPLIIGAVVLIGLVALVAGGILYRIFGLGGLGNSGEAAKSASASQPDAQQNLQPDAVAGKYDHVHLSGADTAEAEKDEQRAAWRIDVAPYLALGSGRPGKAASDFDKPDGVAFSSTGALFATDAKNRRVQVWDVKTGAHLAEFGHGVFGGEIVDIAITPDNQVLITDQTLNLAYVFAPPQPGALDEKGKPLGPYDYQFKGTRFGEQGFKKLGGVAVDTLGRIYAVDAHRNDVYRFNPDGKPDKTWKFEKMRADGDTHLHGCEGIAIDEAAGNLFIASEKDAVVEVFDWETGAYKHEFVGAGKDDADKPVGKHVFFGSVEGLAIAQRHLLAVDESAGHIQIFDLSRPDAFNTDLDAYASPRPNRPGGYQGFIGHAPLVDFEDKTNLELQKQVKTGSIIPGQANPPGYFCSPDSIASYTDQASGETYIAVADQCNYRLIVYRWSDIAKALGIPATTPAAPLTANKVEPGKNFASPSVDKVVDKVADVDKSNPPAPKRSQVTSENASKPAATSAAKIPAAGRAKIPTAGGAKAASAGGGKAASVSAGAPKPSVIAEIVGSGAAGAGAAKKHKKAKKEKGMNVQP